MLDPRLGQVEYKLRRAEFDLLELRRKTKLAYQVPDATGLANPITTCTVTYNVTVSDYGTAATIAGATVYFYQHGTAIQVASGVTNGSGSVKFVITTPYVEFSGQPQFDWFCQGPAPYIDNIGTTYGGQCETTYNLGILLDPNTFCPANRLARVLHARESYYNLDFYMTYEMGNRYWYGWSQVNYPGTANCTHPGLIGIAFTLTNTGIARAHYQLPGNTSVGYWCPVDASQLGFNPGAAANPYALIDYDAGSSVSCAYPVNLSRTLNSGSGGRYGGGAFYGIGPTEHAGFGAYLFPGGGSTLTMQENY